MSAKANHEGGLNFFGKKVLESKDFSTAKEQIDIIEEFEEEICGKCGESYEVYPILMDNNPLSLAMHFELEELIEKEYNSRVCKKCRDGLIDEHFGGE